jgi:hypothetical protein
VASAKNRPRMRCRGVAQSIPFHPIRAYPATVDERNKETGWERWYLDLIPLACALVVFVVALVLLLTAL